MKRFGLLTLCLFLYSLQIFSKTIIISDIDDTLKKANSVGKIQEEAFHFFKKIPYIEMRDLFNEIKIFENNKSETTAFYYVSAAYKITFDAQEWLHKYNFPIGRSNLRALKNKESTYDYKHAVIKNILLEEMKTIDSDNGEELHVLMFGDNASADARVYNDLSKELGLKSEIYIRDVRAEATFFDSTLPVVKIPGIKYYFSEVELFLNPEFNFLSNDLIIKTYKNYHERKLIPTYTFTTLTRRLESLYGNKSEAKFKALNFWADYHLRF